jgi:hypothetical protein
VDRHLNLFYTYNRDVQFIENNLTRAWIVSLRALSGNARHDLLKRLLTKPLADIGQAGLVDSFNFIDPQFALQNHMEKSQAKQYRHRFVLAIATEPAADIAAESSEKSSDQNYYDSIPDAWIFDADEGYCILVESKVFGNPVSDEQINSHAKGWLNLEEAHKSSWLLSISWNDVAEASYQTWKHFTALNDQERHILDEFILYLLYHRYRPHFAGFDLASLPTLPTWALGKRRPLGLDLPGLIMPPKFRVLLP